MKTTNPKTKTNKLDEINNSDNANATKGFDFRHSIRRIGLIAGILILVVLGLGAGLFIRLYYEPRMITYKFDGFSAALPFKPTVEILNGMPPFSNRKMIRYRVVVADDVEYQILVLDIDRSDDRVEKALDLKLSSSDTELEQVAESTIAVLCAAEDRSIKKGCLQKGSRLTRWSVVTSDGRTVHGNVQRDRSGKLIQLLATGTSEEETVEFFDSLKIQ